MSTTLQARHPGDAKPSFRLTTGDRKLFFQGEKQHRWGEREKG